MYALGLPEVNIGALYGRLGHRFQGGRHRSGVFLNGNVDRGRRLAAIEPMGRSWKRPRRLPTV